MPVMFAWLPLVLLAGRQGLESAVPRGWGSRRRHGSLSEGIVVGPSLRRRRRALQPIRKLLPILCGTVAILPERLLLLQIIRERGVASAAMEIWRAAKVRLIIHRAGEATLLLLLALFLTHRPQLVTNVVVRRPSRAHRGGYTLPTPPQNFELDDLSGATDKRPCC